MSIYSKCNEKLRMPTAVMQLKALQKLKSADIKAFKILQR